MDRFNEDKEILYIVGDYVVAVTTINDPILEADTLVYGVYNTATGVREAEARRLTNARVLCKAFGESEETLDPQQSELDFTTAGLH